ncbi:MAG: hypothetical protein KTR13_02765 [Saprospiraceae bacterium]|nr:hypothetical protein [Saprospiraceae bacterium]
MKTPLQGFMVPFLGGGKLLVLKGYTNLLFSTKAFCFSILFSFISLASFGQYTFDGNMSNCASSSNTEKGEYINADFANPQSGSSTCDVRRIFADTYTEMGTDFLIFGLEHGNSGQSNFRLYLNADCDVNTGQSLAEKNLGNGTFEVPIDGAEFMINLTTNNNPKIDVYEWDGTTMVNTNSSGLEAELGNSCDSNGDFVEVRIPLDLVFDPCDDNSCDQLKITSIISNAGGSPNSNFCNDIEIQLPVPVNTSPDAEFEVKQSCDLNIITNNNTYLPIFTLDASATVDIDLGVNNDALTYQWSYTSDNGTTGTFTNESGGPVTDVDAIKSDFILDPNGTYPATFTFTLEVVDSFNCGLINSNDSGVRVVSIVVEELDESQCVALPVELVAFSGKFKGNNQVDLEWITASEENNDFFEIQRSYDGVKFSAVGTMDGNLNATSLSRYTYTDLLTGTHSQVFYRLRQVDLDTKESFSDVIRIQARTDKDELTIYPQDGGGLVIGFESAEARVLEGISIYSATGYLVHHQELGGELIDNGFHQRYVDVELNRGAYIVIAEFAGEQLNGKLIR